MRKLSVSFVLAVTSLLMIACRNTRPSEPETTDQHASIYQSMPFPLTRRSSSRMAGVQEVADTSIYLYTGEYEISFDGESLRVAGPDSPTMLLLQPLGPDLNQLALVERHRGTDGREHLGHGVDVAQVGDIGED